MTCKNCKNLIIATQKYSYLYGTGWVGSSERRKSSRTVKRCKFGIDDEAVEECSLFETKPDAEEPDADLDEIAVRS